MKANELRIGNLYVNYEDKICSWGCDDFAMLWKNQGLEVDELIRNFIPLTEEWLLKFGFELDYKSDYSISYGHIKNCKFSYKFNITENKSWLEYHGGAIECKYAHQLQNIYFALTGEELAIA